MITICMIICSVLHVSFCYLQIFDVIDKTGDGKITRTEVTSASNMVKKSY